MKYNYFFILTAILLLSPETIFSQEVAIAEKDRHVFEKYVEEIASYRNTSLDVILEKTAEFFIGCPYVAHTLDKGNSEQLVINLTEFDCVTFVENVLALSLVVSNDQPTIDNFIDRLRAIRYRNGKITDFASRLHYTSDWLYENQKNNLLENISESLSGIIEREEINFMSTHQNAYKQLKSDEVMHGKIVEIESNINDRGGFYYLPKNIIAEKAKDIPHMAMIAFVTAIKGLDTTHVGFAYRKRNGELSFIHASSKKMNVVIDSHSLSDYCLSQKKCKGIIIAKIL